MLQQIDRFLSSRAAFIHHEANGKCHSKHNQFLEISDHYHLFWDEESTDQCSLFESTVVLKENFFEEITSNLIPIDMRHVRALKASPMDLDVYQWLAYRYYTMTRSTRPT